jgi:hypothetical protein
MPDNIARSPLAGIAARFIDDDGAIQGERYHMLLSEDIFGITDLAAVDAAAR